MTGVAAGALADVLRVGYPVVYSAGNRGQRPTWRTSDLFLILILILILFHFILPGVNPWFWFIFY